MKAALITYMPAAQAGAEPPGETAAAVHAGRGIRISAACQSGINDTLFTTILQEGITVETAPGLSAGDITLIIDPNAEMDAEEEDTADACSLLMQLMVLNTVAETGSEPHTQEGETLNGISGVMTDIPDDVSRPAGLETAAPVIPDRDDTAAAILSAPAETKTAAEGAGLPEGNPAAVPFEDVLAGIADALKNELNRDEAAQDTQAAPGTNGSDIRDIPAAGEAQVRVPVLVTGGTAADRAGETPDTAPSAPPAGKLDSGIEAIPPVAEKTDGDNGGGGPDGSASREKAGRGAAASVVGVNATPAGTGVNNAIPAEKAAAVERALNRFADDIMSVRGGRREIRIVLEPESLGVLTISVVKTESGISAKIRSEDREIAAVISDQVQRLVSSIESKGITVSDIDVAYSHTEQDTGFSRQGYSQAREEASKGNRLPQERNTADDTADTEVWHTFYGGGAGGDTTVDYRI